MPPPAGAFFVSAARAERACICHHGDCCYAAAMCNLYSVTKGQTAIRELARVMIDRTGNLPPLPGIFPDYGAPIVREGADGRELALARWGMPSPAFALEGKRTDPGVTNIRNVKSPHWRRWLGPEHRCLVPFTSFSENELRPGGSKEPVWFCIRGRPAAGVLRRDLDALDVGTEAQGGRGIGRLVWLPDDDAERRGRASASAGHAGHPDDRGGTGSMAPRTVVRSERPAASVAG